MGMRIGEQYHALKRRDTVHFVNISIALVIYGTDGRKTRRTKAIYRIRFR